MCSSFTYLGTRHPRKKEGKKNLVSTCVTEHIVMSHVRWTLSYDDSFVWAIRLFYMPVRDMAHGNVKRMMDSFMSSTWSIHMCNVTHSHMQHDTFTCATWTWPIRLCKMTRLYDSLICQCVRVKCYTYDAVYLSHSTCWCVRITYMMQSVRVILWLVGCSVSRSFCHMYDTVCSSYFVTRLKQCIRVISLHHTCDMTPAHVWRILTCNMTASYAQHDAYICAIWLLHMYNMAHHICDMPPAHWWYAGFLATRVLSGAIGHSILRTSVKPRRIPLSNSQDPELVLLSSNAYKRAEPILDPSSFQLFWKIKFWERGIDGLDPARGVEAPWY